MGRRSVNTTKSGKFMNPTDQARKEARKRELKKNKKQRMAVRHAVLKAKDPIQLLEETALYDKQEYDPSVQAQLHERVIQEKRKKLLETFDRLVLLYRKEDASYASKLQAARENYDKQRHEMMLFYEQVKLAERVKASDIPLPNLPQSQMGLLASDIPLPSGTYSKGILKKSSIPGLPPTIIPPGKKPPGPPPGTPPNLSDSEDEGGESSADQAFRQRTIRFAADGDAPVVNPDSMTLPSQRLLLPTGQGFPGPLPPLSQIPLPPPTALPPFTGLVRPGFPGAPQPNQIRFNIQRPPVGPTLSAPPSLVTRDPLDNADVLMANASAAVVQPSGSASGSGPTIEARPQLKNLIGDATRFVPTALKVRRTVKDAGGRVISVGGSAGPSSSAGGRHPSAAAYDRPNRLGGADPRSSSASSSMPSSSMEAASKDNAYEEFMREMEGLL